MVDDKNHSIPLQGPPKRINNENIIIYYFVSNYSGSVKTCCWLFLMVLECLGSSGKLVGTISTYPGTDRCPWSRGIAKNLPGKCFLPSTVSETTLRSNLIDSCFTTSTSYSSSFLLITFQGDGVTTCKSDRLIPLELHYFPIPTKTRNAGVGPQFFQPRSLQVFWPKSTSIKFLTP